MKSEISFDEVTHKQDVVYVMIHRVSRKPLARCTFCVKRYGGAPKTDNLKLITINGYDYLACRGHRGQRT